MRIKHKEQYVCLYVRQKWKAENVLLWRLSEDNRSPWPSLRRKQHRQWHLVLAWVKCGTLYHTYLSSTDSLKNIQWLDCKWKQLSNQKICKWFDRIETQTKGVIVAQRGSPKPPLRFLSPWFYFSTKVWTACYCVLFALEQDRLHFLQARHTDAQHHDDWVQAPITLLAGVRGREGKLMCVCVGVSVPACNKWALCTHP